MTGVARRWLAWPLIVGGAAALLWVGAQQMLGASYRRSVEATLDTLRMSPILPEEERASPAALATGDPVGSLEIVRVGLKGVVVEGDDDSVLDRAIGHLPDTPLPWHTGNSALAAHRDALFRPLRDVRLGDVLRLKTPYGDFDYRVRETLIVKPQDVWVIDPTPTAMLTLISCYPFDYIGHAPERFIVRADRIPTQYRGRSNSVNANRTTRADAHAGRGGGAPRPGGD
jgi:sortase A